MEAELLFVNVEANMERMGIFQCSGRSPQLDLHYGKFLSTSSMEGSPTIICITVFKDASLKTPQNMNFELLGPPCCSELQN